MYQKSRENEYPLYTVYGIKDPFFRTNSFQGCLRSIMNFLKVSVR